ncbi:hypothetical protein M2103_001282 [Ereboglobus sp. PH5-5]|uniref:anti-sigma factor family protein n=1 Tax=unclassified Ereboglobus TaxID=2626932 RepID=UPI002406A315|nr:MULTISPECIES: hypothetical protein [unclassified Ereboglobus]MDF9828121.1 hypothetical protein [Ereboglobus sp. PH5-10]MDF9833065.1 hypothetical protein [Ereboglobus sp. PH5-5]
MKDKRFIELLNLCVDHQITPDEARELEAELHANPARQRTYLQYCRMQKACSQLFEAERAHAPATPRLARALASANRKITHAPVRARFSWWRNPFAIGGLATAMAACAAVFLINRAAPSHTQPALASESQPSVAVAAVIAEPVRKTPAPAAIPVQPQPKRFRLPVVTSFSAEQNNAPLIEDSVFAWTKDVQLRPLRKVSTEDIIARFTRLENKPINASLLHVPAAGAHDLDATEMTVIEFKR